MINLKENDPFCSLKDKKKYGPAALYFVSTVSMVKKLNIEMVALMLSKAKKDCVRLFNNEEQRRELCKMYGISPI